MIEITRNIEKEIENRSANNTIFKKAKWFINIMLFAIMIVPTGIIGLINKNLEFIYLTVPLSFIMLIVFFYFYVNPYGKKELLKLNIEPSKGFFAHWGNKDYQEFKYKNFITILKAKRVLTDDDQINISLLDEYSKYYTLKADKSKLSDILKTIGATILVFFIPLWNQFLGKLYQTENQEIFNLNFKFSFKILSLIIVSILFILYIKELLKDILDTKSKKMNQIADELLNIKWNIKLGI
jgi:hypothetical protein